MHTHIECTHIPSPCLFQVAWCPPCSWGTQGRGRSGEMSETQIVGHFSPKPWGPPCPPSSPALGSLEETGYQQTCQAAETLGCGGVGVYREGQWISVLTQGWNLMLHCIHVFLVQWAKLKQLLIQNISPPPSSIILCVWKNVYCMVRILIRQFFKDRIP